MPNALSKIRKRANAIRRRHPKTKYQSALKQAGKEFRAGKLKTRRKPRRPKKRVATARRRKVAGINPPGRVIKRANVAPTRSIGAHKRKPRRRRPASRRPVRSVPRRVGQRSSAAAFMPVLALGGLAILAYAVLHKPSQTPPPVGSGTGSAQLVPTGNAYRDNTAQNILAWAAGIGMATEAIIKLIAALNNSDDQTVNQVANSIDSTGGLPYGFIA